MVCVEDTMIPVYEKEIIRDMFYFWNRCNAVKFYPRRQNASTFEKYMKRQIFVEVKCYHCGNIFKDYRIKHRRVGSSGRWDSNLCRKCRERIFDESIEYERVLNEMKANESFEKFKDLLLNCEKAGTCDILSAHHELLSEDPDRLTTDFLIGVICGDEKKEKYVKSRGFREAESV